MGDKSRIKQNVSNNDIYNSSYSFNHCCLILYSFGNRAVNKWTILQLQRGGDT